MVIWVFISCASLCSSSVIYLQHFHKAGGTTLCSLARLNGELTTPYNCNGKKDQTCCGESTEDQLMWIREHTYTFVANERYVPKFLINDFYTVVTIRKPLDRLYSHYRHVKRAYGKVETFEQWATAQPDNYYVRMLCGLDCKDVPRGQLGNFLHVALRRLRRFHFVVVLERAEDAYLALCKKLSWSKCPIMHKNAAPTVPNIQDHLYSLYLALCKNLSWSKCPIMHKNAAPTAIPNIPEHLYSLDRIVYEFALHRFLQITGQTQQCDNSCCGVCSTF